MPLNLWRGKRVLLTGHIGFKGAWLSRWLARLGAEVVGLSLPPPTSPSLHEMLSTPLAAEYIIDLGDPIATRRAVHSVRADMFCIWRLSLLFPQVTKIPPARFVPMRWGRFISWTRCRHRMKLRLSSSLRPIRSTLTTKVASHLPRQTGLEEMPPIPRPRRQQKSSCMPGSDPSCWTGLLSPRHAPAMSSVAGIGRRRLIPDIIRAARSGHRLQIRRPDATRPWQHVLDPLHGYLLYAQELASGKSLPSSLNFAPDDTRQLTVREIADSLTRIFDIPGWEHVPTPETKEKNALALDASLAHITLGWKPTFSGSDAIASTIEWYKAWALNEDVRTLTDRQIASFEDKL